MNPPSSTSRQSGAKVALPKPVERALRRLGQEISIARRLRRLSQGDLALRIGTSLSTVRRMEDGYAGTALHTFLRALQVLGRLDALVGVMAMDKDVRGMELVYEQLPQRVRSSGVGKSTASRPAEAKKGSGGIQDNELEGF